MAEAIRDGLRLEAIAADIAHDGDTALELLSVNAYDIAASARSSPPWMAPATASTQHPAPGALEASVDRASGLSVRLKLTFRGGYRI